MKRMFWLVVAALALVALVYGSIASENDPCTKLVYGIGMNGQLVPVVVNVCEDQ